MATIKELFVMHFPGQSLPKKSPITTMKDVLVRHKVIQTKYPRGSFNILKPIPNYLENLPSELIVYLSTFLTLGDITNLSEACERFTNIFQTSSTWILLINRFIPGVEWTVKKDYQWYRAIYDFFYQRMIRPASLWVPGGKKPVRRLSAPRIGGEKDVSSTKNMTSTEEVFRKNMLRCIVDYAADVCLYDAFLAWMSDATNLSILKDDTEFLRDIFYSINRYTLYTENDIYKCFKVMMKMIPDAIKHLFIAETVTSPIYDPPLISKFGLKVDYPSIIIEVLLECAKEDWPFDLEYLYRCIDCYDHFIMMESILKKRGMEIPMSTYEMILQKTECLDVFRYIVDNYLDRIKKEGFDLSSLSSKISKSYKFLKYILDNVNLWIDVKYIALVMRSISERKHKYEILELCVDVLEKHFRIGADDYSIFSLLDFYPYSDLLDRFLKYMGEGYCSTAFMTIYEFLSSINKYRRVEYLLDFTEVLLKYKIKTHSLYYYHTQGIVEYTNLRLKYGLKYTYISLLQIACENDDVNLIEKAFESRKPKAVARQHFNRCIKFKSPYALKRLLEKNVKDGDIPIDKIIGFISQILEFQPTITMEIFDIIETRLTIENRTTLFGQALVHNKKVASYILSKSPQMCTDLHTLLDPLKKD
jgi:hypothetical protein